MVPVQRRGKDLRIGDSERERAIALLGEHLTAGRLDIHEYDQRCGKVAEARFTSELQRVFDDLPGPYPHPVRESAPAPARSRSITTPIVVGGVLLLLIVVARQVWLLPLAGIAAVLWFSHRGR